MAQIVTLTPNPAIDVSASVERVVPILKLRCTAQRRDPGGGGINVARVIERFGGDVEAIFPVGGFTGKLLQRLIESEGVPHRVVEAKAETREDFSVSDLSSESQYRFVFPGEALSELEWRGCLSLLAATTPAPKFVVGSGSLPPGVPNDFYAQAADVARKLDAKFFLDTSGAPLAAAVEHGVDLIKPNLHEMSELAGAPLKNEADWLGAARKFIEAGKVDVVALSLGHLGAMVVTRDEALRSQPLMINQLSTVGAGDSFLGALVLGLARGNGFSGALRLAAAAGAAALTHEGTELCRPDDAYHLSAQAVVEPI